MRNTLFIQFCFLIPLTINCQTKIRNDSINKFIPFENPKLSSFQLMIPSVLIGFGLIGLKNNELKLVNDEIKEEVNEHIDKKISIDDFMQFAPALSVYSLNILGIKGKNNLPERSIILATSLILMTGTVSSLKYITKIKRPDGIGNNSFPSGHTATAFAGATFLLHEYYDQSPWYGISGYFIATGTGFFRIYNKRHWLTDVVAGAGIGILSTEIAYALYPLLQQHLLKSNHSDIKLTPFFSNNTAGLNIQIPIH